MQRYKLTLSLNGTYGCMAPMANSTADSPMRIDYIPVRLHPLCMDTGQLSGYKLCPVSPPGDNRKLHSLCTVWHVIELKFIESVSFVNSKIPDIRVVVSLP